MFHIMCCVSLVPFLMHCSCLMSNIKIYLPKLFYLLSGAAYHAALNSFVDEFLSMNANLQFYRMNTTRILCVYLHILSF